MEFNKNIKIAFFNNKLKKELFRQINLLSYNNKELIKKTWNGKQKFKKLTFEEDLDLPLTDSENDELSEGTSDDSSGELSDNIIQ